MAIVAGIVGADSEVEGLALCVVETAKNVSSMSVSVLMCKFCAC